MADTDKEENIYNEKTRQDKTDNDELDPREDAFMRGYDEDMSKEKDNDLGATLYGDDDEDEK